MIQEVLLPVDDGTSMVAFVARHKKLVNPPGVMIYHDAFGVNEHFKDVAVRYAAEGFVAIVPELFHRTGTKVQLPFGDLEGCRPHTSKVTIDTINADVRAAYTWLTGNGVAPDRVACTGFCLGGRVTYLANAILPLAGAVSYYAGALHQPAYTALAPAQHAPIVMIWAGLDKHLAAADRRATADAMTAAGKIHTQLVFSDAEHGFFCNDRNEYHPGAARESWALSLEYYRTRGLI
jgi:carboxymethylenebutenolidase